MLKKKGGQRRTQLDSPGLPRLAHEAVVLSLGPLPALRQTRRSPPGVLRGCLVTCASSVKLIKAFSSPL